jgi:pyruvate, water dikinase
MDKPYVIPLSKARQSNTVLTGNKAAKLGELASRGMQIPDGFVVTTNVYTATIHELISSLDDTSERANEPKHVREALLTSSLPGDVCTEIIDAYQHIHLVNAGVPLFAARSSSLLEDSERGSLAGQFHTSLAIRDRDELLRAIKECWASVFDAVVDRLDDAEEVRMAVLVQGLVPAEKSGVMFTYDPFLREEVIVVEATWGLGAPLVGGEITPDRLRASRSGHVLEYSIGSKRQLLHIEDAQLARRDATPDEAREPCLSERDVVALALAAEEIGRTLGPRQDIEFAFHQDRLWILQARPITGIQPTTLTPSTFAEDW